MRHHDKLFSLLDTTLELRQVNAMLHTLMGDTWHIFRHKAFGILRARQHQHHPHKESRHHIVPYLRRQLVELMRVQRQLVPDDRLLRTYPCRHQRPQGEHLARDNHVIARTLPFQESPQLHGTRQHGRRTQPMCLRPEPLHLKVVCLPFGRHIVCRSRQRHVMPQLAKSQAHPIYHRVLDGFHPRYDTIVSGV